MLTERIKEELNLLVEIGKGKDGKLDSITYLNFIIDLSSDMRTEEVYSEVMGYLGEHGIEIVNDGIEPDDSEEPTEVTEIRPFDPSKIDIEMKTMELSTLIKRIRYNEVNLKTDFQRKGGLWTKKQKSQLIESLLLRIPIPAFYFDGGINDNWLIIDGLQRISTLKEFVVDESLVLTGLEFFNDLEGLKFSQLPRTFIRRIEESNIIAFIVKDGTPSNVKYNIFKRINTGGLELSSQEIRHAIYQGKATVLCKRLAALQEFKIATFNSIKNDRMMDQEFVLRFIAVCYYGIENYDGVPDNYLNGAMEYLNSINCADTAEIEKHFKFVMQSVYTIMGKYAFRKLAEDGMRRPINKAIYEAWCKNIFALTNEQVQMLVEEKRHIYDLFLTMCQSESFLAAIKSSDKKAFEKRFQMIKRMFEEILYDKKNHSEEF